MTANRSAPSPWTRWTTLVPIAAVVLLAVTFGRYSPGWMVAIVAVVLIGAVLAAVHHAEVIAHRLGEPLGSLVLAVAVTVIEVALIVALTADGGKGAATLARDTVFAALMLCLNGIVGLSLIAASAKHYLAKFNAEGASSALATVVTLAAVCLVLPRFTTTENGPEFTAAQLAFAAVASMALYILFVFGQTIRYRDFFLPVTTAAVIPSAQGSARTDDAGAGADEVELSDSDDPTDHGPPPTQAQTQFSLILLLASLIAVVGLAKVTSPSIESAVSDLGLPQALVGVIIAMVVLLPESIAAVRAAARNRLQIGLNLAYGSAMASIGLTIPAIAIASIWLDGPLQLGLTPMQIVLLAVTVVVSVLTVASGKAKVLQGGVHLVLCAAFLFLSVQP